MPEKGDRRRHVATRMPGAFRYIQGVQPASMKTGHNARASCVRSMSLRRPVLRRKIPRILWGFCRVPVPRFPGFYRGFVCQRETLIASKGDRFARY